MLYFIHKYMISLTSMHQGSLEPVYDIYSYQLYYMMKLFMHYGRLRKKFVFYCMCTNLGCQECELKRK
jgi:hypothetical protein